MCCEVFHIFSARACLLLSAPGRAEWQTPLNIFMCPKQVYGCLQGGLVEAGPPDSGKPALHLKDCDSQPSLAPVLCLQALHGHAAPPCAPKFFIPVCQAILPLSAGHALPSCHPWKWQAHPAL